LDDVAITLLLSEPFAAKTGEALPQRVLRFGEEPSNLRLIQIDLDLE
jgi:hypothetical protein